MLTQRRTVSESSRARWLTISTTTMIGDIASTGPRKCFAIFQRSVMQQAGPVVIEKNDDRAAQRHRLLSRRRRKSGNQTDQIAHQDEHADAADHRQIFHRVVAGRVLQQIARAHAHRVRQQRFHALLRAAGIVHRQPPLQPREKNDRDQKDHAVPWRCDSGSGTRDFQDECAAPRATPTQAFPAAR